MLIKPRPNLHDPLPDGRTHPSLSEGNLYVVATLSADSFRVVDDEGEPILVPRALFDVLDDYVPADWMREEDKAQGWSWCGPPQFAERGFFERWHDGHARERAIFARVYEHLWRRHEGQLKGQPFILQR